MEVDLIVPHRTVLVEDSVVLEMDEAFDEGLVGPIMARGEEQVGSAHFAAHVESGGWRGEGRHEIGDAVSQGAKHFAQWRWLVLQDECFGHRVRGLVQRIQSFGIADDGFLEVGERNKEPLVGLAEPESVAVFFFEDEVEE